MKNLNSKILLFLICFGLFMLVSQTKAEGTTTVQLKVVAFNQVLFNNDFNVNSCPDQASSTNYSLNAWCAIDQLIFSQGWTATSTWYPYGVMLNAINQYEGDYSNYWLWFSNSEPGETALNQHILSDGEKLLLSFGTSPLKITASLTSPYINSTTTLSVFYFDTSFWQWQLATDSTFSINGQEISSASGTYELWTNTTTAYEIFAKEAGFINSELITINPQLPSTNINLRVVAFDQILFDDNFIVNSCPDQASSTNYSLSAWCAIDQLISSQGWTASSTWSPFGIFLNRINQYDGSDGNYWLWFSNSEVGSTALSQRLVTDEENLLLVYGTSPLKITASSTSPLINSTTTLSVFYFDTSFWQWTPAASSTFSINGQEISSVGGIYELWTNTTTAYEIFAKEAGFIDSELITINPQLPSTNINLRIETASSTIFNQNLAVLACEENVGSGIYSLNGRCAVVQSGLTNQWTSWGSDLFLDSIADYINNQDDNGIYWSWFKNFDYGQTALNKHILSENEELLLIYGVNPLRITTAAVTPLLNSTTTLYLEQFGYDSGWNPVWQPAASSTFSINGQEFYSQDGIAQLTIATTSPYLVFGRKTGYLDSPILTLTGIFQNETSSQPAIPDNPVGGSGSPGFNTGDAPTHHTVDINKAINFLILNQNNDGSIGSSIIYSDWAAIALSALGSGDAQNKLKNYLSGAGYNTNGSVTDLERRAMALMALSVDPYSETATDYISKIVLAFDGTQIGDPSLFNDDIFALFPLSKAGYSGSDSIISATVKFIISKQSVNGSWGNIDLTAAAMQALSLAKKTGNLDTDIVNSINQSLQSAKNFLKNSQGANGGFNNDTISTSWAVQAIPALGEQVLDWENNGNNPFDFLASRQNGDGGFEDTSVAADTRIWTTAYVIPAALGKTWDEILGSFQKQVQSSSNQNNTNISPLESASNLSISTSSVSDLSASTSLTFATTSINENMPELQNATSAELILGTSTASSKTPPQMAAEQNLSVGESINSIQQNEPNKENDSKNLTAQISNSISIDRSAGEKAIKMIFYLSAGVSVLLGIYLLGKILLKI